MVGAEGAVYEDTLTLASLRCLCVGAAGPPAQRDILQQQTGPSAVVWGEEKDCGFQAAA